MTPAPARESRSWEFAKPAPRPVTPRGERASEAIAEPAAMGLSRRQRGDCTQPSPTSAESSKATQRQGGGEGISQRSLSRGYKTNQRKMFGMDPDVY